MKMNRKNTLYCFTPLVSLGTFAIEICLALYVLYKHRKTQFGTLTVLVLLALASFQLPEYLLCVSPNSISSVLLMQIAFVATTFLPIFGLHLVYIINNKKYSRFLTLGYLCAIFVSFFIIQNGGQDFMHICTGKYIIFNLNTLVKYLYLFNYVIFIGSAIVILLFYISKKQNVRINLYMLLAFLSFIIPAQALYFLASLPHNSLPSVTCGFAIITASVLIGKVTPLYFKGRV